MDLNVVLVGSLYSRNVGYVSRAMANMGASRLILIDCKCEYDLEARQGAAGAQTHIMTATRYSNWTEFFANEKEGPRIAFCARRKMETDKITFEDRVAELLPRLSAPLYLIFGPEDHGLSNADVEYANYICELSTFGEFKSMNLSHAVLVALYAIQSVAAKLNIRTEMSRTDEDRIEAANDRFQYPDTAIKEWLTLLGFKIGDRRIDAYKVLKRILLSNLSTNKELRILEAIVFQTIRKLKSSKDTDHRPTDNF